MTILSGIYWATRPFTKADVWMKPSKWVFDEYDHVGLYLLGGLTIRILMWGLYVSMLGLMHGYLGLRTGVLDQASVMLSRPKALTLIDCKQSRHSHERFGCDGGSGAGTAEGDGEEKVGWCKLSSV